MTDFYKRTDAFRELYRTFPRKAGTLAVNFSKERFVKKNWVDKRREKWPKRKRKDRGSLMVRTGRLKRSIRKTRATRRSVTIVTDVPYAQPHNDGAHINKSVTVKKHTRRRKGRKEVVKRHKRKMNLKLPQRQFIGESALLQRRIERMVEKDIHRILNK